MLSLALLLAGFGLGANALSSTLQTLTATISPNPEGVTFQYYMPTALYHPPPLIVALHYCTGTGSAYFSGTGYATYADTHGYIVIYPTSPHSGTCWDVSSPATLTHNGGGDSIAISSVVKWAIANWGVDSSRVYAVGTSSGAMMTNVLLGAYPDIFAAGASYSGVPFGCFAGTAVDEWNSACALGQVVQTPAQWGDLVRNAYPGYTGRRPAMQQWHGTADTTLYPQNFWEGIKQWTNVDGYSQTPTSNITNSPTTGYSTATYGPLFVAILAQGVGHTVPDWPIQTLQFFNLTSLSPNGGSTTTSKATTTTTSHASTTSSASGATQTKYGQCGGIGWTGPTTCASGSTCTYSNAYYSQCL
ncbi:acetyl xylan esterase [Clavulina sp. PMI_390]|nr:acetyl xylan esterase [Clavulina sp. PMI_390]